MTEKQRIKYHAERYAQEFHLGMTAKCTAAVKAHLKLASLHLDRTQGAPEDRAEPVHRPLFS